MTKIKSFSENLSSEFILELYKLGIFLMAKHRFDKQLHFVDPH